MPRICSRIDPVQVPLGIEVVSLAAPAAPRSGEGSGAAPWQLGGAHDPAMPRTTSAQGPKPRRQRLRMHTSQTTHARALYCRARMSERRGLRGCCD